MCVCVEREGVGGAWLSTAEMPRTTSGHFWHTGTHMTSGTDVAHGEAHQGTTTLHQAMNILDSLLLYLSVKTELGWPRTQSI